MDNEVIGSNGHDAQVVTAPAVSKKRPSNVWLIVVAALFIIVPFLTWYFTWFGRALSDEKVAEYLVDEKHPRNVQHALAQVEERIERKDASVKKFYPQVVTASKSSTAEVRKTAAWVMGQDNTSDEFHRALVDLLKDSEPLVRRNAALQLVSFGDGSGRPEFRAMLEPFEAKSPLAGTVVSLLTPGTHIQTGGLLARIRVASGSAEEFRAPVSGSVASVLVKENDAVANGQTVASIVPDRATVLAALRALAYIGTKDDLAAVEGSKRMDPSTETVQQAVTTEKAIQTRGK